MKNLERGSEKMKFRLTRVTQSHYITAGSLLDNRPHQKAYYSGDVTEQGCWFIDFETLDELMEFIKELTADECVQGVIINCESVIPHIEIYDDYRE